MPIKFADLFAGIGGFHAVGHSFGWNPAYACDIDEKAREIYEINWSYKPSGDITKDANDEIMLVPKHDVLFAGFPCQPFSKSGKLHGMDEVRGTLFWNIAKIIGINKPAVILLENVPNLAGARHRTDWLIILSTLRKLGYRVSDQPLIISPHQIPKKYGGRPQTRKRIYIAATYVPSEFRKKFSLKAPQLDVGGSTWQKNEWDLISDIKMEKGIDKNEFDKLSITKNEILWLNTWDDFVKKVLFFRNNEKLPGFPIWADVWLGNIRISRDDPEWKKDFIIKNRKFYKEHKKVIDAWLKTHNYLESFPPSRRKLEWQAGSIGSLYKCLIQLRPSGIRVKKINYAPALVAITQTTIVGPLKRRLSVKEVTQLQGLPSWFNFHTQAMSHSYRQLGNGISIGCAYQVLKALAERDESILTKTHPKLLRSIKLANMSPDSALRNKP